MEDQLETLERRILNLFKINSPVKYNYSFVPE